MVQAPGAQRISVTALRPGLHCVTNLDLNDANDPRIRLVFETLEPAQFVASAERICRDERIVIRGADRGTISSSLIVSGIETMFCHLMGDSSQGEYVRFTPILR
jgi:hypothetical protein